jgi:regulator of protease activity HflC (stomatin/prohibitin superfamily)
VFAGRIRLVDFSGLRPRSHARPRAPRWACRLLGRGAGRVAEASRAPGGAEAIQLKVAQQYIEEFGKVINNADTIILPSNLSDVAAMITTAMNVVQQTRK